MVALDTTALSELSERLGDYVRQSEQVMAAIAAGHETAARQALDRLRSEREVVNEVASHLANRMVPKTPDGLERLRQLVKQRQLIASHDQTIDAWRETLRQPDAELLDSPNGLERFVDLLLPLDWDVSSDVAVLCGRGSQALAAEFIRRGQRRLLVYWPSAQIPDPPVGFFPGVRIVATAAEFRLALLGDMFGPAPRSMLFRSLDSAVDEAAIETLKQVAARCLEIWSNAFNTVVVCGELWVTQALRNLPRIAATPSVASLVGAFAGRPALIISPGPSLAKNIELCATLKGHALILTSVQTIASLVKCGLQPDLALIGDPTDMTYLLSEFSSEEIGRLGVAMTAHPKFFELGSEIFTFSANDRMDAWMQSIFEEDSRLPSGGSISCTAFSLALKLGCDPIILVGQDLAFASNGEMYIATSPHSANRAKFRQDGKLDIDFAGVPETVRAMSNVSKQQRITYLPGYYGGKVPTSQEFAMFHGWFEHIAALCHQDGKQRKLFNCTEGGVFIAGMENRPLAEVAAAYLREEFDVNEPFRRGDNADFVVRRARTFAWVAQKRDEVLRAVELGKQGETLARQMNAGTARREAWAIHEESLEQTLERLPFFFLVKSDLYQALERLRVAKTPEQSARAGSRLHRLVLEAAERLLPLLSTDELSKTW